MLKKAFFALLDFLEGLISDDQSSRLIKSPKTSKRKGFRVTNPTPFIISELEVLVDAMGKGWVIEHQTKPTQNKASGEWYAPSVYVGQPFATQDRDEMFAEMQDWD